MTHTSTSWNTALKLAISLLVFTSAAAAQSINSGSNGSDGALDLSSTPKGSTVVFSPSNYQGNQHNINVFNFTGITIPAGVTLRVSTLQTNGPVYWLVSGNVDIEGTIDLSGQAGFSSVPSIDTRMRATDAGAGGYAGGVGGTTDGSSSTANEPLAQPGNGPGGGAGATLNGLCNGYAGPGSGGTFSGNNTLIPLVGGSGGGGGMFQGTLGTQPFGADGGAGGGALLIASSGTLTINGTVNANGGAGGSGGKTSACFYNPPSGDGGGGSGGAIRLAASTIAGTGTVTAAGGAGSSANSSTSNGGNGVVRLETYTSTFTGTVAGTKIVAPPLQIFLPISAQPTVSVVSVGGVTAPQTPMGSFTAPDVTINSTSPVQVTLQTSGIPVGTVLTLQVFSDNLTYQTVTTTPLIGTFLSATTTASITFPSDDSLFYVKAKW